MRTAHAILRTSLVTGLWLLLPCCGAGLIGIAANQSNSPGETRPPELTLSPLLPLVPVDNTTRTVVVTNAQIPASAQLRVQIEAAGVVVDQGNPTVSGQGGSTVVAFTLATGPIVARVGDPTAADVDGLFQVLVDGNPVAAAVPIVLARQPRAVLDLDPGVTELFLAPAGQLVRMRVEGLLSTEAANVQMFVTTRDPTQAVPPGGPQPTITRLCTGLTLGASSTAGEVLVTASAPGNSFPDGVRLFLSDAVAGQSTVATNAYYQPDIALALPRQGPTTGGNLVTLIGTALVPYDFTVVPGPAPLAFGDVELSFRKGDRLTVLPREDFRTELSDGTRLVFRMPASPDGRPGQVDIVLRVRLGVVDAVIVSSQVFLFANPHPFFGPRGAVLDTVPVAVAPIPLDGAPGGDDAPDFAVLTEEGGVGFLQLLLAQENGMFQRFGARRQIGDHEVAAERTPRDLCTGDFDGDLVPDMFIANEGAATATHHLVLGQAKPNAPLGAVHRIPGEPGTWRSRAAFFDADALPDLLLVPGVNAPVGLQPQVRLARPLGVGQPAFAPALFVPVRNIPYEATEIADLDGDGFQDVAVVSGTTLQMDVAFGRGDGTFDPAVQVDFTVPGYTPTADAKAIGLHACRDGTLQSLAVVLSGSDVTGAIREPLIAVLHQTSLRTFAPLVQADVQVIPGVPLSVSLAADLDQSNTLEIAVGVRDVAAFSSLALLRYIAPGFQFILGGIETGAEQPRKFTAMHFGRAFPATSLTPEAKAVFVVHESEIDGVTERRLSTRLLFADSGTQSLTLLPPDAGAVWPSVVEGIVGGDFHEVSIAGAGSVRDLALARAGGVDLLENDGFGGFPLPSSHLDAPGLLPHTLQLLPASSPTVDNLVFVDSSSRVGIWTHVQGTSPQVPTHLGSELRLASSSPLLQTTNLSDATRVRVADVDGDGTLDLVVLLSFALPSLGEGQAQIALLRGKPNPAPNEFPFAEPTALTPVHGKASSMALGDFAAAGPGLPKHLELAVSVPEGTTPGAMDGDHVRFFRYVAGATPEQDRFEPSAAPGGPQVLLAGSMPTQLEAADFDADGLVDLLVAAAGDDTLRLFRNIAPPSGTQGHVELGQFFESLSSPKPLAPGTPRALRLGDVNGDHSIDAIATVESVASGSGQRSTSVAFYLQSEPGVFEDPVFVSPQRVGNRNGSMAIDLGDWNRDGVLDLFLGWNTTGAGDRNVRVLFGGSR